MEDLKKYIKDNNIFVSYNYQNIYKVKNLKKYYNDFNLDLKKLFLTILLQYDKFSSYEKEQLAFEQENISDRLAIVRNLEQVSIVCIITRMLNTPVFEVSSSDEELRQYIQSKLIELGFIYN